VIHSVSSWNPHDYWVEITSSLAEHKVGVYRHVSANRDMSMFVNNKTPQEHCSTVAFG